MNANNEAIIVLCKCGEHHKTYGIRAEKRGRDTWMCTWAFPIKESAAKHEGYDKSSMRGSIAFSEEFPGCPYCGGRNWTVCSCGRLNCTIVKNNLFICEWCGAQGKIGKYAGESITAGVDL